jgi:hypothetical protein
MKRSVLLTGLLFFMVSVYNPSSAFGIEPVTKETLEQQKLNYELQERCGQKAAQVYKDHYDLPLRNYRNHYNAHLNKCFMLVTDYAAQYLVEVNEHKESMFIWRDGRCIIEDKSCNSLQEWDAFVKKMMEE